MIHTSMPFCIVQYSNGHTVYVTNQVLEWYRFDIVFSLNLELGFALCVHDCIQFVQFYVHFGITTLRGNWLPGAYIVPHPLL